MTSTDDLDRIRERVAEARQHGRDLLRSPYTQMSPWAITKACVYWDHPTRQVGRSGRCVCGKLEEGDPA